MILESENPNSHMLHPCHCGNWYVPLMSLCRPLKPLPQTPLLHHYHPSISLHAHQLLSSEPLTASADLSLNTLSHFLDRFVYKNPKKPSNAKPKGASIMQPAAGASDGTGVKLMKGEILGGAGVPVNEEKFWRRRVEDIPVDQVYLRV